MFGRADFERLAETLRRLKGRFLMSVNDTLCVRETFAGFHMTEISTTYTVGAIGNTKAAELLISGEPLA